jgi:hypothetical protein
VHRPPKHICCDWRRTAMYTGVPFGTGIDRICLSSMPVRGVLNGRTINLVVPLQVFIHCTDSLRTSCTKASRHGSNPSCSKSMCSGDSMISARSLSYMSGSSDSTWNIRPRAEAVVSVAAEIIILRARAGSVEFPGVGRGRLTPLCLPAHR